MQRGFLQKDSSLDYSKKEEPKHNGSLPELGGWFSFLCPFSAEVAPILLVVCRGGALGRTGWATCLKAVFSVRHTDFFRRHIFWGLLGEGVEINSAKHLRHRHLLCSK